MFSAIKNSAVKGCIRVNSHRFMSKFVVKAPMVIPELSSSLMNKSIPRFLLHDFLKEEKRSLVAIVDGSTGQSVTYKEAHDNAYSFATSLRKFGIKRGDCVAIVSPNHLGFFTSYMGVSLVGATSTCVNPMYSEYEIENQVKATDAKLIITHSCSLEKVLKISGDIPVMVLDEVKDAAQAISSGLLILDKFVADSLQSFDTESFADPEDFSSDTTATIPFSSGTTGKSKGVMLTHKNIIANILQMVPYEGKHLLASATKPRGVTLVPLPFFHIYGMVVGMMIPLQAGAKMVFMPAFDLKLYLELVQTHKVTRGYIVPPIALALAKHPMVDQYDMSSITSLMSGAAPLGFDVQSMVAKRLKCIVKQGWGMTEMSPVGTVTPEELAHDLEKLGATSGALIPGTEGKIVDPLTGKDIPSTEEGEIMVRGPQIMKGYLNNPEATAETIEQDGWLHTGDIGKFNEDGMLYLTDRMKELIKYKGFQVPPAELEALICSIPEVKDCIVIPVEDEEAGEIPRAYVVKQENAPSTFCEQDVVEFINSRVAPFKKLRGGVRFTDIIPKSPAGKLLRRVQKDIDRELDKKDKM